MFQYYFSKVTVRLLYGADVFLSRFDVASTHHFLKEPIFVHRGHIASHPEHVSWNFSE